MQFLGNSKSQRASKLHFFKSHFAEWVDFAHWWSFIGKGLRLQPAQKACFKIQDFLIWPARYKKSQQYFFEKNKSLLRILLNMSIYIWGSLIKPKKEVYTKLTYEMHSQIFYWKFSIPSGGFFRRRRRHWLRLIEPEKKFNLQKIRQ